MANHRVYQELVYRNEVLKTMVIYHLQTVSGKSGQKVNGTRLFGSFQWKLSGSNGTSEKVVPFFPDGMFQTEIRVPFLQSHLWYQFQALFFGKWNWFVQMVNAIPVRNLPVLNFAYHLPKPWTDRFAHVNGKQSMLTGSIFNTRLSQALMRFSCKFSQCAFPTFLEQGTDYKKRVWRKTRCFEGARNIT